MNVKSDKKRTGTQKAETEESLSFIDKNLPDNCPKQYPVGIVLVLGMTFAFLVYLTFVHVTGIDLSLNDYASAAGTGTGTATSSQGTQQSLTKVANSTTTTTTPSVFLGVEVISIDDVMMRALNLETKTGVLINMVVPNSPAQIAGLQRGDVIISIDTKPVKDVDTFKKILAKLTPGETIRILYFRNDRQISTYAKLVAISSIQQTAGTIIEDEEGWGASLSPLSPSIRDTYDIPAGITGVVITTVVSGGIADSAGLKPGDVITAVDKTVITDMSTFLNAISSDNNSVALLDVYFQGTSRFVPIDSSSIQVTISTETDTQATITQKLLSLFGGSVPTASTAGDASSAYVFVAEHENEEDGYEKPVCKRLEETGDRYENKESTDNSGI